MSIYLDNNATTRPLDEVVAAVDDALREHWHNPSSVHRAGQAARRVVELARQSVARLIGAKPREIVFTSGGTESIDLAVRGVLGARGRRKTGDRRGETGAAAAPVVVTTAVEHAAVRDLLKALSERGECVVREAALLAGGVVDVDGLRRLLDDAAGAGGPGVALVTIQWANNETGAIQPVEQIGALCRERGIVFHCDGVQWVGKAPTDVSKAPFDLLSISAHKMHGPKGVGALWVRRGVALAPVLHGTHEAGRRGGTENVPGIAGFGVAAEHAARWVADESNAECIRGLRDRFERAVLARAPEAVVNAPPPHSPSAIPHTRLANTSNIAFPRLEAEALLIALSERGVCASAGAACSSGSLEPSPVLLAMGIPPELAHGSLRFSLSGETTEGEVDEAAGVVAECAARLRAATAAAVGDHRAPRER